MAASNPSPLAKYKLVSWRPFVQWACVCWQARVQLLARWWVRVHGLASARRLAVVHATWC
jgi:hypothetical protein